MTYNSVLNSLRNPSLLLRAANEELNRPEEDVVTLAACECTRNSVIEFLGSYLTEKKILTISQESIGTLLTRCCKEDAAFKSIDISCFSCKALDKDCIGGYCLDVKKIKECFESAKVVEEFVLAKLKVNPKNLE